MTGYQIDKDSLPFQKKELKNYCLHVLHISPDEIEISEDAGKSGKNTDRPAFQRMMKKVKSGKVGRVLVYKIDRISRNLVDFSLMYDDFKANRTTFISLNEQFDTGSAIGEAVLKILLVFAELECKLTSERVNAIIKDNSAKSQTSLNPHKKKHTHVFAGVLRCADCGAGFQVSRLDKARLNGFIPSQYICTSRRTYRACEALGVSDVVVGAFVFNFVANLVAVSAARREYVKAGIDETEKRLLQGDAFSNVLQIDAVSLRQIFDALRGVSRGGSSFIPAPLEKKKSDNAAAIKKKRSEAAKIERALERLKKAYLFDDNVMNEREYITTRARLEEDLTRLNNEIANKEESAFETVSELSFVTSASEFLLSYQIQSGDPVVYSDFAPVVGNETLKAFIQKIIDRIEIKQAHVSAIVFKNGLDARFILKNV